MEEQLNAWAAGKINFMDCGSYFLEHKTLTTVLTIVLILTANTQSFQTTAKGTD